MVRVRFLLVGPFLSENLCCSSFLGHSYSSLTGRIIKSDMYFSEKVNTIRDKTDFLAFYSYFWTTLLVQTFNSVSSSMWKRLHHSFRPHRFGRFYRLQYFYHAFHFIVRFVAIVRLISVLSTYRLLPVFGMQERPCVCSIYDIHESRLQLPQFGTV